jgi:hypothetical protein
VFENLSERDVNSLHLVCRNLHELANLYVNPKLQFSCTFPEHVASLVQSSRIFEKLEFNVISDKLSSQKKFGIIEEYIRFTGCHVKKLHIYNNKVNPEILQKLLNLLPNLEFLELFCNDFKTAIQWDLKNMKIEKVMFSKCAGYDGLIRALEQCKIKEVDFGYLNQTDFEVIKKFLATQEQSLEKLSVRTNWRFLVDLKDVLKQLEKLKFLGLVVFPQTGEVFNLVWELTNLEILELSGDRERNSALNNLHKLQKLKRLQVTKDVSPNILEHLQFGVFNNLEELDCSLAGASVESVQEMGQITPNLKRIVIRPASVSAIVNKLLDTLEHLEAMKLWDVTFNIGEKSYPKIKYLDVSWYFKIKFSADEFSKLFPNLEFLRINYIRFEVKESFFVELLSGLKRLKTFYMYVGNEDGSVTNSALQCFQQYGKHLEDAYVVFWPLGSEDEEDEPHAIEKRPMDLYCVRKYNSCGLSWQRDIF